MFQRAKSFIIRRKKDPDHELELPDSSHLVRRPVTANMHDRIDLKAMQKVPAVKPNMDFSTLRQKSTSLENVTHQKPSLNKTPLVLSTDGLDTIRRKKEQQKKQDKPSNIKGLPPDETKNKTRNNGPQKTKLVRVNSKRKKNQDTQDQRNSFVFVKMTEK